MINILRAIFADLNRNQFIFKDNIFYLPHIFISYVDKYISLGIKLAIYSIAMQGNKNEVKTPNFLEIRCNCLILNN